MPLVAQAQFFFTTNNGAITITQYSGSDANLVIPSETNGWPITSIGNYALAYRQMTNVVIPTSITNIDSCAFWSCIYLNHVTIPQSVTSMGLWAFGACGGAYAGNQGINVFFQGDKPTMAGGSVIGFGTLYRLPGTTGWDNSDAVLWNPQAQTNDENFGVRTNQFGFNITGTADIPIVVEASTNLLGPWVPLQSVSLTNGVFYCADPQWANYSGRFYRICSP